MKIEINKDGTVTIDGEVFVRQQSEVVDKEALLQEAKKRYPIGTEVISVDNGVSYLIDNHNTMRVGDYGIHVDVTDGIDISVVRIFEFNTKRWAEILPSFPTIEEMRNKVSIRSLLDENDYIQSVKDLTTIAKYYNDKYPKESITKSFITTSVGIDYFTLSNNSGQILFTISAAKEAIKNPNVIEVLNKYFRISK